LKKPIRVLGHPIHPIAVHVPVACWLLGSFFDGVSLVAADPFWWLFSNMLLVVGVLTAVPAMVLGMLDLVGLPSQGVVADTAQRHMIMMCTAWVFYLISFFLRFDSPHFVAEPVVLAIGVSLVGLAVLLWGAWYGAALVYHHGVGTKLYVEPPKDAS
jgi:uncharacterized membrane protein